VDPPPPPVSTFLIPSVPELLSPMVSVLPLQLLACLTAEIRGTNPDSFRADDPTFQRINDSYKL
jgi:glutamine---fructose-6-phosphate transaminase (isomerizing)